MTAQNIISTDHAALARALRGLGEALEYPGQRSSTNIENASECLRLSFPEAHQTFERFAEAFLQLSPESREELATGTFEITPVCLPYVSIHLFGEENFKRGEFMAAMTAEYAKREFDAGGELPDHIAVLLRYAAELTPDEQRELFEFCVLGPLSKMIRSLEEANPYRSALKSIQKVIQAAFPGLEPARSPLEQMQQHDAGCAVVAPGCHCGPVKDHHAEELVG